MSNRVKKNGRPASTNRRKGPDGEHISVYRKGFTPLENTRKFKRKFGQFRDALLPAFRTALEQHAEAIRVEDVENRFSVDDLEILTPRRKIERRVKAAVGLWERSGVDLLYQNQDTETSDSDQKTKEEPFDTPTRSPSKRKRGRENGEAKTPTRKKRKLEGQSGLKSRQLVTDFSRAPHIIFATSLSMPTFASLQQPLEKFQEYRKHHKRANVRKEVNSLTEGTLKFRLKQVDQQQGQNMNAVWPRSVILSVAIFHCQKACDKHTKSQEFLVLPHQRLTDLKDNLYCLMNEQQVGKDLKNSFFFIEDTFYDDCRHEGERGFTRLSQSIVEFVRTKNRWSNEGLRMYKQAKMEETTFEDLHIRLGSHYLFVHQGDCQHSIIFSDMRMVRPQIDVMNRYAYPWCIYQQVLRRQKCGVCETYPASFVTYGDKLTTHDPFFFCRKCYAPFHYDVHGRLLYDDFQVFPYVHD